MNIKQRKVKKVGCVVAGLATLVLFVGARVCGMFEDWYRFGFFLAGCIMMWVLFVGTFISLGVDTRFNQLEEQIDELRANKQQDNQKQ